MVVLAAGQGSRMRSALPKPLHPVAGVPMVSHVLTAAAAIEPARTVLVVGRETHDLAARLGRADLASVPQPEPNGTGDALRCALAATGDAAWVMVLFADHPLLTGETVRDFLAGAVEAAARVTILSCPVPNAKAFGRVARDSAGNPLRIVERKDDRPEDRMGEIEINSGMMLFTAPWLHDAVGRLTPSPATGEYYMTELVALAVADGPLAGGAWPVATVTAPREVVDGVNDRAELASADAALRRRIRAKLMRDGVSFVAPETCVVDAGVEIGPDTTMLPGSVISAGTRIGAGCTVGPQAVLTRAVLGDDVVVGSATVADSTLHAGVRVGPYAHIRGGSILHERVHVGTQAEVNRSTIGAGSQIGHFSYLGDAMVGTDTNIGAGVVTANYDGVAKHRTTIGDRAFIGSHTVLVAPVVIGDHARTGAGAVVTHDVAPGDTVIGVPARVYVPRQTVPEIVSDPVRPDRADRSKPPRRPDDEKRDKGEP